MRALLSLAAPRRDAKTHRKAAPCLLDGGMHAIALRQEGHVWRRRSGRDRSPTGGTCLHHALSTANVLQITMTIELLTELGPSALVYYKHETPGGIHRSTKPRKTLIRHNSASSSVLKALSRGDLSTKPISETSSSFFTARLAQPMTRPLQSNGNA